MITLHFHLQPQYKYELFHINFTSFHCTGRYELNKLTSLPMCGFIAQLVEHRTGISRRSRVWIPLKPWFFFRASSFQLLKMENYCDDHSSLSSSVSLKLFFEKIKNTFQIERFLARKNNKLLIHGSKWKPLLQLIQQ